MAELPRRLYRSRTERMLCGVAGGMGAYFDVDPSLIRLLFIVAAVITGGMALLAYVALCLVIPLEGEETTPAARLVEQLTEGEGASMEERERVRSRRQAWGGAILIILGILFLASNLGLLWWLNWRLFWQLFWPLILIGLGLLLFFRRVRES